MRLGGRRRRRRKRRLSSNEVIFKYPVSLDNTSGPMGTAIGWEDIGTELFHNTMLLNQNYFQIWPGLWMLT